MPAVGLGTAGLLGESGYDAVRDAVEAGYRHIDTATAYRNESEIGRALRDSGVDRSQLFITTKLPPEEAGRESAVLDRSLRALQVDYIDLWLVHWPPAGKAGVPTWRALLRAHESRKVRAVGVSNYDIGQLDELTAATGTPQVCRPESAPSQPRPVELRTVSRRAGGDRRTRHDLKLKADVVGWRPGGGAESSRRVARSLLGRRRPGRVTGCPAAIRRRGVPARRRG